jgi:hypothetical protein
MRRDNRTHAVAFVGLALSMMLLISGLTRGAPAPGIDPACGSTCANRYYFINPSASSCQKWGPLPICTYCASGQCTFTGVDPAKCKGMPSQNV